MVVPFIVGCAVCFRCFVCSFSFLVTGIGGRRLWLGVGVKDHLLNVGVFDAENGNVSVGDKTYDGRIGNVCD